jgi:hypothetical protein
VSICGRLRDSFNCFRQQSLFWWHSRVSGWLMTNV